MFLSVIHSLTECGLILFVLYYMQVNKSCFKSKS